MSTTPAPPPQLPSIFPYQTYAHNEHVFLYFTAKVQGSVLVYNPHELISTYQGSEGE